MAENLEMLSVEEAAAVLDCLGGFFDEVRLVDLSSREVLAVGRPVKPLAEGGRRGERPECGACGAGGTAGCEAVPLSGRMSERYELAGDVVRRIASKPLVVGQDGRERQCAIEAVSELPVTGLWEMLDAATGADAGSQVARVGDSAQREGAQPPLAFRFPLPLMGSRFDPGSAEATVAAMEDEMMASLAQVELSYLRGSFETASRETEFPMRDSKDLSVRATAGLWNMMANMATGHVGAARHAKAEVEALCVASARSTDKPQVRASCSIVGNTIAAFFPGENPAHAPVADAMEHLPEGQRLFASYLLALRAFDQGEYGHSLGVANTALALCDNGYPVSVAYLHIISACDYMALRKPREAAASFKEARRLMAPDGIVSPLVEHYTQLQGLPETYLKPEDPVLYRAVSKAAVAYRMGWISLADPEEAQVVAGSSLTAAELTVAALAKHGWTNREMAVQLGISANTVKHRLSSVFQKLGIDRRADLSRFRIV